MTDFRDCPDVYKIDPDAPCPDCPIDGHCPKKIVRHRLRHKNIEALDPEEWAWRRRQEAKETCDDYWKGAWK